MAEDFYRFILKFVQDLGMATVYIIAKPIEDTIGSFNKLKGPASNRRL